ncbi:MAG: DUF1080 domain-containing protein [Planctomycetota bacterium]
MMRWLALAVLLFGGSARAQELAPLFDGETLRGWHGQRQMDPLALEAMPAERRKELLDEDDREARLHWTVKDGALVNDGKGPFLTTDRVFGDAEYRLEYRTVALADSGIYLRGTPQVQIWDTTEAGGKWKLGADKGSGGLWNNQFHERMPLVHADRPFGEWNALRIVQVGERTSVWLNGELVVDWVVMENYWNRAAPLIPRGPLQLQTHGGEIRFRNLMARDIPPEEANRLLREHSGGGFEPLFDGKSLRGWQGAVDDYEVLDGAIRCKKGRGGNLFTERSYRDFAARLEFRLPPGGNNGLSIRYPGKGDAAYDAMEIQVLDDYAPQYRALHDYQYCGSVYGVVPAKRGYLRPAGEWNYEEVSVEGTHVTVALNGTVVVDADVAKVEHPPSGRPHEGRFREEGFFGFCGHDDPVEFRAIAIRPIR